jgi:hypothetical protein
MTFKELHSATDVTAAHKILNDFYGAWGEIVFQSDPAT